MNLGYDSMYQKTVRHQLEVDASNSERKQEGRRKPEVGVAPLDKKGQLVENQAKVLRLSFDSGQPRSCISVRQSSSNSPALNQQMHRMLPPHAP